MKFFLLIAALVFGSTAHAATLQMKFDATVDASGLGGGTSDLFVFDLTFDDQTPDNTSNTFNGQFIGAVISGSLTVGTDTISFDNGDIF